MTTTAVRRAAPDDAPELVRLRHEMFRAMAVAGVSGHPDAVEDVSWYPAAERSLAAQMQAGSTAAFVVDGQDRLRACSLAALARRLPGPGMPRGLTGSISSVFVEPEYRGLGLGNIVVRACLEWLEDEGAEVVDLHSTPEAERLYRSLGFSEPTSLALRRVTPARAG